MAGLGPVSREKTYFKSKCLYYLVKLSLGGLCSYYLPFNDICFRLNKWGLNTYLYAPKDDYKHRAYWRELYTVEEAEHLTGLITAAKESGVEFYYALSPGLDITYSNAKEIAILKRKLEQVSQFGCQAFALLFDDIEPEMSEADKEVFQSFAHAQVEEIQIIFWLNCRISQCAQKL